MNTAWALQQDERRGCHRLWSRKIPCQSMSVIWNASAVFRKRCSQVSGKTHNAHPADPKTLAPKHGAHGDLGKRANLTSLWAAQQGSSQTFSTHRAEELVLSSTAFKNDSLMFHLQVRRWETTSKFITSPSSKGFPTQRQHEQSTRLSPFFVSDGSDLVCCSIKTKTMCSRKRVQKLSEAA